METVVADYTDWFSSFAGDDSRVSLTEISLTPAEFDSYRIAVDLSLTFCLKELRVS